MTTTTPATPATAVTVTLPADDLELIATLSTDVITHLENQWHAGMCGCRLPGDDCAIYGDKWRDYTPAGRRPGGAAGRRRRAAGSGG